MKNKMLFPSCSEMVFRLKGSLEEIKEEVMKILKIWGGKENTNNPTLKKIKRLRQRVNEVKDLNEFHLISFDFTYDYETYFKKEGKDLLVATTRNEDWDELNFVRENEEKDGHSYWDISGVNHYKELFCDGKNLVAINKGEDNDKVLFLEREDGKKIKLKYEYEKIFKLAKRRNYFYLPKEKFVKLVEIKDEKMKNKLKVLTGLQNE